METINVEQVKKRYGRKEVLKGASFHGNKGECIGIVGVNGSGKSTLLSILAGVLKADSGNAVVGGIDIIKKQKEISKLIGYVPQDNPLISDLTVKDNLRLWYCDSPYDMDKELESGFLKLLGIDEFIDVPVKRLSGGMKKRVSIGVSMHAAPKVLMLDEPSAALDLIAKKNIRDYLKEYMKLGGTVVIVTHDEEELELCNKIYVVSEGVLKQVNSSLRGEALLNEIN